MTTPEAYLSAAERTVAAVARGARGTWPRTCAWLTRLALETALDDFWAAASPPVAKCRSRRAQFLLLREHTSPDIARRASHAWASLSRAGHHQSYELALTSQELRALGAEVAEVVAALKVPA